MNNRRAAYTLMEMLLVLALLIIVSAISVPVISSMLSDTRISASGDQVRGVMAETRARAMEDGQPWRLAYLANTGVYQLAPEDSLDWDANAGREPMEKVGMLRDQLPQDIVFAQSHDEIMGAQQAGPAGGDWVTIAVYLPDGSAREDTTVYFGKPGIAPMRARLRGLTGSVSVEAFTLQMRDQMP